MIPQYTFEFKTTSARDIFIKKIKSAGSDPDAMRFGYYVPAKKGNKKTKGFFCHVDVKDNITCTTSVRPNKNGKITINGSSYNFTELGFSSLNVSDFHNGEHSKHGCIISVNRKIETDYMHFSKIKDFILKNV